ITLPRLFDGVLRTVFGRRMAKRMSDAIKGKPCRTRRYGAMPETLSELAQFDELVAELMAEWRIPGLALAAVRRNEAPLLRSWGVRDIDTGARVTSDTVFPICSVTKSFTATALALLVDEGRLDWDMQVREVL